MSEITGNPTDSLKIKRIDLDKLKQEAASLPKEELHSFLSDCFDILYTKASKHIPQLTQPTGRFTRSGKLPGHPEGLSVEKGDNSRRITLVDNDCNISFDEGSIPGGDFIRRFGAQENTTDHGVATFGIFPTAPGVFEEIASLEGDTPQHSPELDPRTAVISIALD